MPILSDPTMLVCSSRGTGYASVSSENINRAIDELASADSPGKGGTVWVRRSAVLDSPIFLRSNVTVDFLNNYVVPPSGQPTLTNNGTCERASVRNLRVRVPQGHTYAIIMLTAGQVQGDLDYGVVRNNTFESIAMDYPEEPTDAEARYTGLYLITYPSGILSANLFQRVVIKRCDTAVRIQQQGRLAPDQIDANCFMDVTAHDFRSLVWFASPYADALPSVTRNLFYNVSGLASYRTESGFQDLVGTGNHLDHVGILDWPEAKEHLPDFNVTAHAEDTYLCATSVNLVDNESSTTIVASPKSYRTTTSSMSTRHDGRPSARPIKGIDWSNMRGKH